MSGQTKTVDAAATGLARRRQAIQRGRGALERIVLSPIGMLPVLLVVMCVVFALLEPRFAAGTNLIDVSRQATYLVIVAMGQMFVLLTGGFDLSVAAVISLTSVICAKLMISPGMSIPIAILIGIGFSLLFGLVNGIVVAVLRVSPFIATLGTGSIGMGAAFLVSGGTPVVGIPTSFSTHLGSDRLLGVPVPIYITVVLIAIVYVVLNWTRFGRYVYAIGGNQRASRLSGVPIMRNLALVYVLSGFFAGIAGVLLTARVSIGDPNLGSGFELQSITAAVLGGVSLRGGIGRLSGVVLGGLFIALLANGMDLVKISSFWQEIAVGIVLIAAIVADRQRVAREGE
jgi:ribose transport system permease protein